MRLAVVLLVPFLLGGQVRRTVRLPSNANGGAYGMPAVTFHGKLKELDNKEIVIVSDEDQELTIYRTHKTKFLKEGKAIKPNDIPVGAALTLDVSHAPDLSLLAVNVLVDPQPSAPKK